MEFKGKITATPQAKSGISQRGPWKKAFIVVEYESGQFPKQVLLSNMSKAEDFEKLTVGQFGTFKVDGSVREGSNGAYYMDLNCWAWQIDNSATDSGPI